MCHNFGATEIEEFEYEILKKTSRAFLGFYLFNSVQKS